MTRPYLLTVLITALYCYARLRYGPAFGLLTSRRGDGCGTDKKGSGRWV